MVDLVGNKRTARSTRGSWVVDFAIVRQSDMDVLSKLNVCISEVLD